MGEEVEGVLFEVKRWRLRGRRSRSKGCSLGLRGCSFRLTRWKLRGCSLRLRFVVQ